MSSIIALAPYEEPLKSSSTQQEGNSTTDEQQLKQENVTFVDEIKINDKKVLSISLEHQFHDEKENKPKRKSRWGEKIERKKVHTDVIFNPYLSIGGELRMPMLKNGENIESALERHAGINTKRSKYFLLNNINFRWGEEFQKTFNPPPLNWVPHQLGSDELEYILRLYRLDEVTKKLYLGDYVIHDTDVRSPSPLPIYDKVGQRVNTRAKRWQEYLQREKHDLVEELRAMKPDQFVPPSDYKPPKKSKKIYIPNNDPDNNYLSLVIGPRGSTQKQLEQKTGCSISIRGRGSNQFIKQGALDDDRLYILVQADDDETLESGVQTVERVLRGEPEMMDEVNKNKNLQIMAITGVLQDEICGNCFEKGHRVWACPSKIVKRNDIQCLSCGDKSHVTIDCPFKQQFQAREQLKREQMLRYFFNFREPNQKEYDFMRFLAEVEGENANYLLNLVEKVPQNKSVLPIEQRMAFITETKPGGGLAITDGNSGSSFSQTNRNNNSLGRLDLKGSSTLSMSKFLVTNLTEQQKQKAFQNQGENLDKLFVRDTYYDTSIRTDQPNYQQPLHSQGYLLLPENQIQTRIILPENHQQPQNNPLNQDQIQQMIKQQQNANNQVNPQSTILKQVQQNSSNLKSNN